MRLIVVLLVGHPVEVDFRFIATPRLATNSVLLTVSSMEPLSCCRHELSIDLYSTSDCNI